MLWLARSVLGETSMTAARKILVIDDEHVVCDVIADAFEDWPGAQVTCVQKVGQGAQRLRAEKYDLALIDALLPEIPGLELAVLAVNENTPVVLLSGHPEITETLAGCNFPHLAKPFALADLMEKSREAVEDSLRNIARVRESFEIMKAHDKALRSALEESRRLLEEAALGRKRRPPL
jgi:DNA-binding NtrC family response regulator